MLFMILLFVAFGAILFFNYEEIGFGISSWIIALAVIVIEISMIKRIKR